LGSTGEVAPVHKTRRPHQSTHESKGNPTTIEWQPSEKSTTNWLWQSMANRGKSTDVASARMRWHRWSVNGNIP